MSDLETPEADMIRDQGSVDAARATLRPEKSRPGLDPDNPGAAPDTTLGYVAGDRSLEQRVGAVQQISRLSNPCIAPGQSSGITLGGVIGFG